MIVMMVIFLFISSPFIYFRSHHITSHLSCLHRDTTVSMRTGQPAVECPGRICGTHIHITLPLFLLWGDYWQWLSLLVRQNPSFYLLHLPQSICELWTTIFPCLFCLQNMTSQYKYSVSSKLSKMGSNYRLDISELDFEVTIFKLNISEIRILYSKQGLINKAKRNNKEQIQIHGICLDKSASHHSEPRAFPSSPQLSQERKLAVWARMMHFLL